MSTIVDFENILLLKPPFEITNVRVNNYIVFFTMNGHEFSTQGSHIYHSSHPFYDHPLTRMWAKEDNDPTEILRKELHSDEINAEIDMFTDNKFEMYETVFSCAIELMKKGDKKGFIKYIDSNFFITVEGKGKKLLKKLNNERVRSSKRESTRRDS